MSNNFRFEGFRDCNRFWDDLMFGRCRCRRRDCDECRFRNEHHRDCECDECRRRRRNHDRDDRREW
ncbi:TPA: hypothetical protein ACGXP1_005224 [Bacillus cereus]